MIDETEIHRMANSADVEERETAIKQLLDNFASFSDKDTAWSDLHRLTQDENEYIQWNAADALGHVFSYIPDKDTAWSDLHRLTQDENEYLQWMAADAIASAFSYIQDKAAGWEDIHRLIQDGDNLVRFMGVCVLSDVFSNIPDKAAACSALHGLTRDMDSSVRMYAYHSLGSASVYKATETEDEGKFREELKKAIDYFEKSSQEARGSFDNPARFCLPFYRSYYAIISEKQEAEAETAKYLDEAKKATEGSESREALLKAVNNLANALQEAQKPRDFTDMKSDLNAYRRYCDRACELLDTTDEKTPGASRLIRKGLPIIDERIKGIIAEIQEKAKALCKYTQGTLLAEQGNEVNIAGQNLLNIRDPIVFDKAILTLETRLSAVCEKMPEDERGDACNMLSEIKDERYIEDKINLVNILIEKMSAQIERGNKMGKYDIRDSVVQINEREKGVQNVVLSENTEQNPAKSFIDIINGPATIGAFIGFLTAEIGTHYYPITYNHLISVVIAVLVFIAVAISNKQPKNI